METTPTETIAVELDGKYAGWHAECDADPDYGTITALQSGNFERVGGALLDVVRDWNFQTRRGEPAPLSVEGAGKVPARAVVQLAIAYARRWAELPNPPAGT